MSNATDNAAPGTVVPRVDNRSPEEAGFFYKGCRTFFRISMSMLFDLQVHGVQRVPARGGLLMLSNHQSFLDPPLLGVRLHRPMASLAKSELFESPLFARGIRSLYAFPVRQGKGDVGAMKESIRLLQAGWLLNVFPEGGRTPDGRLHPAQKGAGLMVRRAGVPVLPTVIDGSYEAWPRGARFPKPHPIRILYGEPANISHLKADDIRKWIDDTLARMFDDLKSGRV